jgi:hypothetical protein
MPSLSSFLVPANRFRHFDPERVLGTLANLLQAVHDPADQRVATFINRELESLVSSGIANVAQSIDPSVRVGRRQLVRQLHPVFLD